LGVDQIFPVKIIITITRITAEGHTGGAIITHVPEHHRLDVDGGSPLIRDSFNAAIIYRALAVPAGKNRADTAPQLLEGVIRKRFAQNIQNGLFEIFHQNLKVSDGKVSVILVTFLMLDRFNFLVENLTDTFAAFGLDTSGLFHNHVGIHHDQTAVSVISESLVAAGLGDQTRQGLGSQTDVQNRVHHPRHRTAGAGTHRHEQGIFDIAEFFFQKRLHLGQSRSYLGL